MSTENGKRVALVTGGSRGIGAAVARKLAADGLRVAVHCRAGRKEAEADALANVEDFISKLASGDVDVWTGPINLQDGTEYIPAGRAATESEIWYLPQLVEGVTGASE